MGPFTLNVTADKMLTLRGRGSGSGWLRKWLSLSCTSLPGRSMRSHARGHSPPAHLKPTPKTCKAQRGRDYLPLF